MSGLFEPQVVSHVINEYTDLEKKLLSIKPGITDFHQLCFRMNQILKHSKDPDKDYNVLIRPWKSRLGLFYVENQSFSVDLKLIFLTIVAVISKPKSLTMLNRLL